MKVYLVSEKSEWFPGEYVVTVGDHIPEMPVCENTRGEGLYIYKKHLKEVDIDWETAKLIAAL